MPLTNLNIGAAPNDGTGETLRSGGAKINTNYTFTVTTDTTQTITGAKTFTTGVELKSSTGNYFSSFRDGNNANANGFVAYKLRGTFASPAIVVNNDNIGNVFFEAHDGTNFVTAARIASFVDGTPGTGDMPGNLVFLTRPGSTGLTERMRIAADGKVRIGNLDDTVKTLEFGRRFGPLNYPSVITVNAQAGAGGASSDLRFFASHFVSPSSVLVGICDMRSLTPRGLLPAADNAVTLGASGIRWSAVWAANGTIQTSDERSKTSIADTSFGLTFINGLRPVCYKYKIGKRVATPTEDGVEEVPLPGVRVHHGFIAQDVKKLIDEHDNDFGGWLLTDLDDPDSEQALRYDQFIAPLVKAVQELSAKVSMLENRLENLES
jgi:hypothetical protein